MVEVERQQTSNLLLIGVPGAVGGFVTWLLTLRAGSLFDPMIDLPLCILGGAGAAFVFVVLALNLDLRDKARVVAVSFTAGLVWQPIVSQAIGVNAPRSELVQSQEELNRANTSLIALNASREALVAGAEALSADDKAAAQNYYREAIELLRPIIDRDSSEYAEIPSVSAAQNIAILEAQNALRFLNEPNQDAITQTLDENGWIVSSVTSMSGLFGHEFPLGRQVPNVLYLDPNTGALIGDVNETIGVGSYSIDGVGTSWIARLTVPSPIQARIEIRASGEDLVASLYGSDGRIITADDDGLGMLNPLLRPEALLQPEETYYLRVANYENERSLSAFTVEVANAG